MGEIFVRLLIAHLLTDFIFQPSSWVEDKKQHRGKAISLYLHVMVAGVMTMIMLWNMGLWYIALIVTVTHYLIDLLKLYCMKDGIWGFLVDQLMHLIVLFFCAVLITGYTYGDMSHRIDIKESHLFYLCAYLAVTTPAGYIIGMATQSWRREIEGNRDSLKKAGIWIGTIERLLVLTFVILGQYQAIGFLIAAKSILRFGDRDGNNAGKHTEYVLIGTLMSFAIALFIGLLVRSLTT